MSTYNSSSGSAGLPSYPSSGDEADTAPPRGQASSIHDNSRHHQPPSAPASAAAGGSGGGGSAGARTARSRGGGGGGGGGGGAGGREAAPTGAAAAAPAEADDATKELLAVASVEIRRERSINAALREELDVMGGELAERTQELEAEKRRSRALEAELRRQQAASQQQQQQHPPPASAGRPRAHAGEESRALRDENAALRSKLQRYREKLCDLSLTSSFAVEQMAMLRLRVGAAAAGGDPQQQAAAVAAAQQAQQYQQQQQQQQRSPRAGGAGATPMPTAKPSHPRSHSQPQQQHRSRTAPRVSRPSLRQSESPARAEHTGFVPQQRRSSVSAERNGQLLDRLRRALAPPPKYVLFGTHTHTHTLTSLLTPTPNRETMGILVNSMVQELRRVMRQKGAELPLERKV